MERLALACGGTAVNSFDDLNEQCLGYAGLVYEHVLVRCHCLYEQYFFPQSTKKLDSPYLYLF